MPTLRGPRAGRVAAREDEAGTTRRRGPTARPPAERADLLRVLEAAVGRRVEQVAGERALVDVARRPPRRRGRPRARASRPGSPSRSRGPSRRRSKPRDRASPAGGRAPARGTRRRRAPRRRPPTPRSRSRRGRLSRLRASTPRRGGRAGRLTGARPPALGEDPLDDRADVDLLDREVGDGQPAEQLGGRRGASGARDAEAAPWPRSHSSDLPRAPRGAAADRAPAPRLPRCTVTTLWSRVGATTSAASRRRRARPPSDDQDARGRAARCPPCSGSSGSSRAGGARGSAGGSRGSARWAVTSRPIVGSSRKTTRGRVEQRGDQLHLHPLAEREAAHLDVELAADAEHRRSARRASRGTSRSGSGRSPAAAGSSPRRAGPTRAGPSGP